MAGHSKFKNIMHRKGAVDAKRARVFSKHARLIMNAARTGGADLGTNLTLRYAIERSRADNMTNEAIERAVAKGCGTAETAAMEELTYEGYGQGGVAILVDTLTDNRNRTFSEVRLAMEKKGGNMADSGSVSWNFERKAVFLVKAPADKEDELMDVVLMADADELNAVDDGFEVIADSTRFGTVREALEAAGYDCGKSEIAALPKTTVAVTAVQVVKLMNLVEALDELDDVQSVATNIEWNDETLAAAEGS